MLSSTKLILMNQKLQNMSQNVLSKFAVLCWTKFITEPTWKQ